MISSREYRIMRCFPERNSLIVEIRLLIEQLYGNNHVVLQKINFCLNKLIILANRTFENLIFFIMETKKKFQVEFPVHSSPKILFNYLSTPSGLQEWFADKVSARENQFIFQWEGSEQKAKMVHKREGQMIKFKWLEDPDDAYMEFEIITDELTNDTALLITDFSLPDDIEESKRLWDSQVHSLKHIIGS